MLRWHFNSRSIYGALDNWYGEDGNLFLVDACDQRLIGPAAPF